MSSSTRARALAIEDFAAISAALSAPFADREAILTRAGLDETGWLETRNGMRTLMEARLSAEDASPVHTYREAFQAAREGRPVAVASAHAAQPAPPRLEDVVSPAQASAHPPLMPQPIHTPSYLRGPRVVIQPPVPSSAPAAAETEEHDVGMFRESAPTPFAAVSAPANPERRMEQQRADVRLASPTDQDVIARMKGSLGSASPGETQAMTPAPSALPTPFSGPTTASSVPATTAFLDRGGPRSAPLPFDPNAPSRTPSPSGHPDAGPPSQDPQRGFTVAGSSGARPSMPFARMGAPNPSSCPPGWTIARYAALCIDLHASGLPEERVLAIAQITRDERVALDAYWNQRMMQDPALRLEWAAHADRRKAEHDRGQGR